MAESLARALPTSPLPLMPCTYWLWQVNLHGYKDGFVSMRAQITWKHPGRYREEFFLCCETAAASSGVASAQDFARFQQDIAAYYVAYCYGRCEYPMLPKRVWTAMFSGRIATPERLFALSDTAILHLQGLSHRSLRRIRDAQQHGPVMHLAREPWDEWAHALPGWRRAAQGEVTHG